MADAMFEVPRLAELYDPLDPDRRDLDLYLRLAAELSAGTVVDIGCGTGTLACLLAGRGLAVTGLDPAAASLQMARRKPGADRVRWLHAAAADLPALGVDLATMTGNVAQVFVADQQWAAALRAARQALRPGGWLALESRDPARQAWREWTKDQTYRHVIIDGIGPVQTWAELTEVRDDVVSFTMTFVFDRDSAVLTSHSTLRFRSRDQLEASLTAAGLLVEEVRDAPDRPGREFVFIARRAAGEPPGAGADRPGG